MLNKKCRDYDSCEDCPLNKKEFEYICDLARANRDDTFRHLKLEIVTAFDKFYKMYNLKDFDLNGGVKDGSNSKER